jgi:heptosyltransferase III
MDKGRGLIIFPGALGDLICFLPTIRALGRRHPTIRFELMARAELARFAVQRMGVVAGHSIDRAEVAQLFSLRGGESSAASKFFCQFNHIDSFFASDNEQFCSGLRQAARGEVRFHPFRPSGTGHVTECYLKAIGANAADLVDNSIALTPPDLCAAKQKLSSFGLRPGNFVLVLPGSGSVKKNWPAQSFVRLAERIELTHRVLVVLGPAEARLASIFRGRSWSVASDTELGELAGIAHLALCFIGNDSGVSHLAGAVGARGLVIFGATDPERWRPLGNIRVVQEKSLDSLLPDQVWPVAMELISASVAKTLAPAPAKD